ncbi:hypothetical protein Forpi1262_v013017 [Fusarium oxysporum f. sp. raphani]|uniref:Uncharacterized protein n=1 Tax=Fusarium oxysporum f. sp. raphani TaxID=96318 RepID=A0A8J5PJP9_FUSOX|nr:hypothetical protein Forpi1262_v013017 [Fusarium oxysporum f. sp. raphani]
MDTSKLFVCWPKRPKKLDYTLDELKRKLNMFCMTTSRDIYGVDHIALATGDVIDRISENTRGKLFEEDYHKLSQHKRFIDLNNKATDAELLDFLSHWFPIKVWVFGSKNGEMETCKPISEHDLSILPGVAVPAFVGDLARVLIDAGEEIAEEIWNNKDIVKRASLGYALIWQMLLLEADDYSAIHDPSRSIHPGDFRAPFNVNSRFLQIPRGDPNIRPLTLFIEIGNSTQKHTWLTAEILLDACQECNKELDGEFEVKPVLMAKYDSNEDWKEKPGVRQMCRFVVITAIECKEYSKQVPLAKISSHPLGFYSTYIRVKKDLGALVDIQDRAELGKKASWIWPFPEAVQAEAMNNKLLNKSGRIFRKKMSQVKQTTKSEAILKLSTRIDIKKRQQTQTIMGDSANKWAKELWSLPNNSTIKVAEWLQREAHRFGGTGADFFPNLIFGSKECNTNMIRAENLVNECLKHSTKVKKVVVTTEVHDRKTINMLDRDGWLNDIPVTFHSTQTNNSLYYWLAAELEYAVFVEFNSTAIDPIKYTSVYQPFHRYIPLMYEIKLDERLLRSFLQQIK